MVEQISTPEGFDVVGFQDGPAALEAARRISPTLIIADYHLDSITFSGFCKEVNKLDNLSETYLISLVNPSDRPDESLLKTLGVKAILNKPFQSEDLLEVIKNLPHKTQPQQNGTRLKRRVWPPDSTSTNTDYDDTVMDQLDISNEQEDLTMDHQPEATTSAKAAPTILGPEEAMKGLFGQLLESMTERTEKRIADLLPQAIEKELTTRIHSAVKNELDGQLGEILSQEQLMTIVHPLLVQELPLLIKQEMAANEVLLRQAVSDFVSPVVKDMLDQSVRELAEASIRKQLPDVVREHLGSIDLLVKEEIRQATLKHAPLIADDLVRATAEQTVEQAVQRIVPELAEQHIKAELTRLTATE